jgi:hypothetical protein
MRFVLEAFGKCVYWENKEKIAIISNTEWTPSRSAEKEVLADAVEMFKI